MTARNESTVRFSRWDYSLVGGDTKQLLLEPGYTYTLQATVAIVPFLR